MGSQSDLDQGGTFRQTERVYMGPSVGWQYAPAPQSVILPITATGTTSALVGNSLITFNVAAIATVQLFRSRGNSAGPGVVPGSWIPTPIVIVDIGGNAASFNKTILPFAGESFDGLSSLTIDSNYGTWVITPNLDTGVWTVR